jgi:hypothetical protein
MNLRYLILIGTHLFVLAVGFAGGIYALPILVAPAAPTQEAVAQASSRANFTGEFRKDLKDSDPLHWGEGTLSVSTQTISLMGKLAPGPDYKLYLSPEFVETEADFNRLKATMVQIGDIKTFNNFLITVPSHIDPSDYSTAIVWCESFGQFITSAEYQP